MPFGRWYLKYTACEDTGLLGTIHDVVKYLELQASDEKTAEMCARVEFVNLRIATERGRKHFGHDYPKSPVLVFSKPLEIETESSPARQA